MSAAIQLAFLMDGFNSCHQWKFAKDSYEGHAAAHNGYIGIVSSMEQYAEVVYEMLLKAEREDFHPGVFEYEVTEELGKWLFNHSEHFRDTFVPLEFSTYACQTIQSWFNPNQTPVASATQL